MRKVQEVCQALLEGKIIAYPTDTLFAIGCDPWQKRSVLQLCQIKNIDASKANLSYLCGDMSGAAALIRQIDKEVYKFINRNSPGPVTFILEAGKEVPHHFKNKRKTIGIRIPDHYFLTILLKEFGRPILTTSLSNDDQEFLYPDELVQFYKGNLDIWIDDERPQGKPSAVVDCSNWPPDILRDSGHILNF
ncbi:MAG: threonylcarbamoyl-AMP synthase [Saprospiraceae bacterium]|nr:threonylcarbamoyl-AMP synthase [Saprospiraceae bacterium]